MTDPIIPPYPADARGTAVEQPPGDDAAEVVAESLPFVAEPPAPNAPLPGIAPAMRRVDGGYVREDAHPGVGEPDWKAEAEHWRTQRNIEIERAESFAQQAHALREDLEEMQQDDAAADKALIAAGAKGPTSLAQRIGEIAAGRDNLRAEVERLYAARDAAAGGPECRLPTWAEVNEARAKLEEVQGERDHMSRRLYRFRDAILRAFADTRGENALRQKIAAICAPANFASMLSADADPAPTPAPASTGTGGEEAKAPCGGTRCYQSADGDWVHSSKSYGSCSVRRARVTP